VNVDRRVFVGVDGGQTSSRGALVAADGTVVARAEAGGMTHAVAPDGVELMRRALLEVRDQFSDRDAPAAVFLGLCAVTSGTLSQRLGQEVAAEIWSSSLRQVEGDGVAAWAAGTGGQPGVAVIAGTGSVVEAINDRGEVAETGAWGHLFGDPGSGWDVGASAVRSVLRRWDRETATSALGSAILDALHVSAPIEILFLVYGGDADPVPIAKLAEVVARHAAQGDGEAIEILAACGARLADDVVNAINRLDWMTDPIPVATLGGAFMAGRWHRDAFREAVESRSPRPVRVVDPVLSMLGGDALMALRLGGIEPTDQVIRTLVEGGLGPT
jgi:N-acetylglucosamine kinase-like BadF-type ATPase